MAAPIIRKLKKGELLFNEGDVSKAMYFLQTGTIRLFKKKGQASIELGMIHSGEVIGEMGFLDGGPRSASAEAMTDTDLVEITNVNLAEQLKALPSWLLVLLRTVVNRLRNANNKIRQLENSSTAYTYGSGGVSTTYQYLPIYDVMKICSSLLLVGARNGEKSADGSVKCTLARLLRYGNQIMGVHTTKINELLDILERAEIVKLQKQSAEKMDIFIHEIDQLEQLVNFLNDENLKEHTKKITFSIKGFQLMTYIVKHLDRYPPNADGISTVNLAEIQEAERSKTANGKDAFQLDEMAELVKAKLATEMGLKDSKTINSNINAKALQRMYRIQKVVKDIDIINDQKREQAAKNAKQR